MQPEVPTDPRGAKIVLPSVAEAGNDARVATWRSPGRRLRGRIGARCVPDGEIRELTAGAWCGSLPMDERRTPKHSDCDERKSGKCADNQRWPGHHGLHENWASGVIPDITGLPEPRS